MWEEVLGVRLGLGSGSGLRLGSPDGVEGGVPGVVREHAPRLERGRAHVPRGRDVGCVVDEAVGSQRVGLVA